MLSKKKKIYVLILFYLKTIHERTYRNKIKKLCWRQLPIPILPFSRKVVETIIIRQMSKNIEEREKRSSCAIEWDESIWK